MSPSIAIPLMIICVFLSAFFSATETVFASVNKIKLEKKANQGGKNAKLANKLANNYPTLISTILIGNNLVNIAASSIATLMFTSLFPEYGATIATFVMTLSLLIFGEIIPKNIFGKFSLSMSQVLAFPIKVCQVIFNPIVLVVTKMIDKMSVLWIPKDEEDDDTTGDELINMVEEIEEEGYIDDETSELIQSAIEFKDTTAHEIMTPRVDIFAFNIEDDISELINNEEVFNYSRVVIYEETIDKIIGFLSTRKIFSLLLENEEFDIRDLISETIYVHKTKSISSILKKFKETKTHIAIVVDEFGGTLGIITLEDILEEIVGEIWDETD